MHTAKTIAELLAQRAEETARYLLPNGKRAGHEWVAGSIQGEAGESLKACIAGSKAGVWADFATGDGGDLLDLWAKTRSLALAEALKEASQWLGKGLPRFERQERNFKRPRGVVGAIAPTSQGMEYLTHERKLTPETIAAFKIGERGREIILPYWRGDELIFTKYLGLDRPQGKKVIRAEADCEPCLFGWHTIPATARTITITEGELDAMTLYQYGIPALSVPFGGGTGNKHRWLEFEYERLAVFDEIYLCLDNDNEGRAATEELASRLGYHRCRIVELPHKDANACLQAGVSKQTILDCFSQARNLDPAELKRASSFAEQVIKQFYPPGGQEPGIMPPWDKAKGKILFRPDELSIWNGVNGHGKSQMLGQIILHSMKQDARVCIASLELKPTRLLARLTRQAGALHNPSPDYIKAIHDWYDDRLWVFDLVGTAKTQRLLEVFEYAHKRYGINVFVIDSLLKLDIAEDDYKAQKAFIEKLCDFKNQYGCHIHLVAHPRKGVDESSPPNKLDTKGSGAISDLADNCFTVWRNKAKEEAKRIQEQGGKLTEKQQSLLDAPDCLLIADKQRNGDWEGKLGLFFHTESFQFLNHASQHPISYVNFSRPNNITNFNR